MAINETIVTGRKFRKLIDEATKQWQRFSFWTKASDVEFDDGNTLEDKIVNINGTTNLLQEQVTNLNTDANGKINNLMTEINSLKETVEDLKTNPPSPSEQDFPLTLTGSVSTGYYEVDEDGSFHIAGWSNGTAAYLSSPGVVDGTIQLKFGNGNNLYLHNGSGDLKLLTYPTNVHCPPLSNQNDQYADIGSHTYYANILGYFNNDGILVFQTHNFPAGYIWIGGDNGIPENTWRNNNPGLSEQEIQIVLDFSQATFQQT